MTAVKSTTMARKLGTDASRKMVSYDAPLKSIAAVSDEPNTPPKVARLWVREKALDLELPGLRSARRASVGAALIPLLSLSAIFPEKIQ